MASTETAAAKTPQERHEVERLSLLTRLAVNDWLTFVYLLGLNLAWLTSPDSEHKRISGPMVAGLLLAFVVLVILVARASRLPAKVRALAYRIGQFGCLQASYFVLADLLPAIDPGTLDAELYALDLKLFGIEPAILFDAWVGSATTEWFSFFYYSYFFLLAAHIFPIIFWGRDLRLVAQFGLGMTVVVAVGQTCYMLVPGFGPYHATPELFANQLPPGLWWNLVTNLVEHGGAQKDIFPSLHTALPSFLLMFSFQHRKLDPYRWTWPIVGFIAINIIAATMFLRWHWLIDVIAGLCLSTVALIVSSTVSRWEARHRASTGLEPNWPPLS
jgi:hypothetical protein